MVTSDIDKEVNIKAMQQGADDFLKKPFSVDELIGKIRSATRIVSMQIQVERSTQQILELQEDLNSKAKELKEILSRIIKERIPNSDEQLKRIKDMALWIAEEFGENDAVFLNILGEVCNLCFCGKLFLPDGLINTTVTTNGIAKNEKMERIPVFTKNIIGSIKGFEQIFSILYQIYENYDGSGMPEKKQSRQIPIASRIMRAVLDFEEYFIMKKYSNDKIVEMMSKESKRIYDAKVLTLLDQYQAYKSSKAKIALERPINRKDLTEGMMLSRQIVTESGTKIMGAGTYLTQEFVDKIISITKNDSAIGKIYIKN
ncbi:MAG: HD domain-containing phosphohydrolase, partial [Ignavibacteria bacterium]|nr:HD domain-containing phosphohydrolase [Ignavibacteria bacterium]